MVSPDYGTPWDGERFGTELTDLLVETLAGCRDVEVLAGVVATSAEAAERVCRGRSMACAAGCPHCCVLNVAVLLPEAMIIADWLRGQFSREHLDDLRTCLVTHSNWVRWMDDEERITKVAVCPFLDRRGRCTVHPVRPLVCRAVVSLDRDSCRSAFSPLISDEVRTVPTDLLRQAAYDAAFRALGVALRNHGLDCRSIELGSGELAFLDHPEYAEVLLAGGRLPDSLWW